MNESEKLYLKRKAEQMKTIIESTIYQQDQKFIAFHAMCEDLILLKLESSPNITGPVESLFKTDGAILKDMTECGKQMETVIAENKELQDLKTKMKDLNDERFDLMKQFYREFKKNIEPKQEEPVEFKPVDNTENIKHDIDDVINAKK